MLLNLDKTLTLVRDLKTYLQQEKGSIFASSSDLDYFRNYLLKRKKAPPHHVLQKNAPEQPIEKKALPSSQESLTKNDKELEKKNQSNETTLPQNNESAPIEKDKKNPIPSKPDLYQNGLKNRELGKEAPQKLHSERAIIAEWQSASENAIFEAKPTQSKTDSSDHFGISNTIPLDVSSRLSLPFHEPSSHWKSILGKIAPKISILEEIPNDLIAKKIKNQWKTKNQTAPISILYYQEIPEHKEFLDQIQVALDVYFGPAKQVSAQIIENEKQWEAFLSVPELKLVICCDYTLWQLSSLMQFYKETPNLKKRQLGEKQLFLLPDLSLYLKDPLLKRSLWKAFSQILS